MKNKEFDRDPCSHLAYHSFLDDGADRTMPCSLIKEYLRCVRSVDWKWFATLCFDPDDARSTPSELFPRFSFWLQSLEKRIGKKVHYFLVFESTEKHGLHAHALFTSDIDEALVSFAELDQRGFLTPKGNRFPRSLVDNGYFDCPSYRALVDFCSFAEIRDMESTCLYLFSILQAAYSAYSSPVFGALYYRSRFDDSSKEVSSDE